MSTYGLTREVRALRERVRRFIDEEVVPAEPVLARDDEAAAEAIRRLKARAKGEGLWALGHPKEIGGGGVPFMPFVYLNEVIGRSHWGQVAVGSLSMQDSIMLHLYGTAEQKRRWLEPLVAGDIYPSVGLTEPEVAGSDPTLMQSTARLEGDHWVVNAHKWFTSGANRAAFTTIFAITEPEAPPHERFSAIIVPTDAVGYEILRIVPTMGHTGGAHCEIRLTDVRVPRDHLLGGRGQGFVVAQKRLGPGRIFHCMRWLGQAERAFELIVCARDDALRPWLASLREGRDPALRRRVGGRDPGRAPDDAGRPARPGRKQRGADRDRAHQVLGRAHAARRDRPRHPGARRARRHGRHAARVHVPRGALRAHLRRPRRGAPHGRRAPPAPRPPRRRPVGASGRRRDELHQRPRLA